jgi:hypothetical protein
MSCCNVRGAVVDDSQHPGMNSHEAATAAKAKETVKSMMGFFRAVRATATKSNKEILMTRLRLHLSQQILRTEIPMSLRMK